MHKRDDFKRLLQLIAISVAMLFASNACAKEPMEPKPPMILPILLKQSGNILDTKISVVDHHNYYFSLRFSYKENDQADRARVKTLTGGYETDRDGKPLNRGIPTPVRLSVSSLESGQEIEIFSKEIDPILTSWGGNHFGKNIGFTELKPGLYVVRLELLQAAPAFDGTSVALVIWRNPKTNFNPKK